MASRDRNRLLHGTLDTLVLKAVEVEARHGYGIGRWIETRAGEAIAVEEGSLYPALYRLEKRGLLEAEWGTSELGRRAKFYRPTEAGRARLRVETGEWVAFSHAVTSILTEG